MTQYVKSYRDRHGKLRHYIRKAGFKPVALKAEFGSEAFSREYDDAIAKLVPSPPREPAMKRQRVAVKVPRWLRGRVGGVYFIKGGERIKIGHSSNIRNRINELQTGSPAPIGFVAAIVGATQDEERELHAEFAEYRTHGEWFEYGPRLAEFIALVRTKRRHGLSNFEAGHV